ncbi:MAG: mannose-6-phosphate isomerase, class I [Actinomycetota bacterium]
MPGSSVIALEGVVRPYAWGSRTAIPQLLGRQPTGEPEAELWFGAHPDDPALAPEHGTTLDKLIAQNPQAMLGPDVVRRFGPQLPFLVKILAAGSALSLQVHPTLEQARAGFAAENAAGIALSSPQRVYHDANHKPELLCALSEFDALCGFRPVRQTLRLLDSLDVPRLAEYRTLLAGPDGLRATFTALLAHGDASLVDEVVAACQARVDSGGEWQAVLRAVLLAAEDFPGDVGCVLALLLNAVRLAPGEAIWLAAGNVHAYLRGIGVEVMANSDNVLRCGLTAKHVDVPELLRITRFIELADPVLAPRTARSGERAFQTPAPDFAVSVLAVDGSMDVAAGGPQLLLCTSGAVRLTAADESATTLGPGRAALLAAGHGARLDGAATVFRTNCLPKT